MWKEIIGKHGDYNKVFRYFEAREGERTYCARRARPGFERYQHDHRDIADILAEINHDAA